jgi:endonuclease/exonuclease/phosphatase (EEP) superfamily protein YafD
MGEIPLIDWILKIALAVCALGTLAGLAAPIVPAADIANHMRPYALLASIGLLAAALLLASRRTARWAAAIAGLNLALFLTPLPWSASKATGAAQAKAAPLAHDITLVNFNMAWAHRPVDDVARFLLSTTADVVLLQEVTNAHASTLTALLKGRYPHIHTCVVSQGCTQAIFSKHPWAEAGQMYRASGGPEMIWARFDSKTIGPVRIHGVHAAWPFTPEKQARHVDQIIAYRRTLTGPAIFAGDFNLTPWSYQLQRLVYAADLSRHATLLRSWPTDGQFKIPFPLFLIDHVFTTPDIVNISIDTGPNLGSDHLPIISRLRLPREQ